jgi:hypothetical protein
VTEARMSGKPGIYCESNGRINLIPNAFGMVDERGLALQGILIQDRGEIELMQSSIQLIVAN